MIGWLGRILCRLGLHRWVVAVREFGGGMGIVATSRRSPVNKVCRRCEKQRRDGDADDARKKAARDEAQRIHGLLRAPVSEAPGALSIAGDDQRGAVSEVKQ